MAETLNISTHLKKQASTEHQITTLVLLHGWGLNSAIWQSLIDKLPNSFTDVFNVVAIDLPGFGTKVDETVSPYSLANICKVLSEEIPQPAIYLGWSLGGLVATEMALNYPNKVLGLITVASTPCFIEEESGKTENNAVIWPGIKSKVLESFHQQLQLDTKKTINNFLKIQTMGTQNIRQDIKQISALVFQHEMANKTTLAQSLMLLENSDYRANLKDINQPFLRLYGDMDSLLPKAVIDKINILVPTSDFYIFKQASHAPFISHSDDFKEILSNWLINMIVEG